MCVYVCAEVRQYTQVLSSILNPILVRLVSSLLSERATHKNKKVAIATIIKKEERDISCELHPRSLYITILEREGPRKLKIVKKDSNNNRNLCLSTVKSYRESIKTQRSGIDGRRDLS